MSNRQHKHGFNTNTTIQAILWAAAMIASALILHGSPYQQKMLLLLVVLSTTSILFTRQNGHDKACNRHWFKRGNKIEG